MALAIAAMALAARGVSAARPAYGAPSFVRTADAVTAQGSCSTYSAQGDCDGADRCTWCKSAAVPSACYSDDDAAQLPPAIFACDDDEAEVAAEGGACESIGAQADCDAAADCTWCTSAAVPSKCYSSDDAAQLPPAVFACDSEAEVEVKAQ